jgi:hypothetical protein
MPNVESFSGWCARWGLLDREGAPIRAEGGAPGGVGPGWFPLLDRLVADLFALGWDRRILSVKEKYGGLSFFADGTSAIQARIDQAEAESETVCEDCGAPGRSCDRGGWIRTLCELCDARSRRRR